MALADAIFANFVINELNYIFSESASSAYQAQFFAAFGSSLRYLYMRPSNAYAITHPLDALSSLKHCPALKHMAICPSARFSTELSIGLICGLHL
jgi:hypothetical protein